MTPTEMWPIAGPTDPFLKLKIAKMLQKNTSKYKKYKIYQKHSK